MFIIFTALTLENWPRVLSNEIHRCQSYKYQLFQQLLLGSLQKHSRSFRSEGWLPAIWLFTPRVFYRNTQTPAGFFQSLEFKSIWSIQFFQKQINTKTHFSNFFQTLFDDNIQEHLEHGDPPWLSGITVGKKKKNQYHSKFNLNYSKRKPHREFQ